MGWKGLLHGKKAAGAGGSSDGEAAAWAAAASTASPLADVPAGVLGGSAPHAYQRGVPLFSFSFQFVRLSGLPCVVSGLVGDGRGGAGLRGAPLQLCMLRATPSVVEIVSGRVSPLWARQYRTRAGRSIFPSPTTDIRCRHCKLHSHCRAAMARRFRPNCMFLALVVE